jgi:3-deoxy-7-phosphoheptulonate synthase
VTLRGGRAPNYDAASVEAAARELHQAGIAPRLMVDASHANSNKNPENQPQVLADVAGQVAEGERRIMGVMIESNILAGRQDVRPGTPLTYGRSITDGCIDWGTTVAVLEQLADAVAARRRSAHGAACEYSA